MLNVMIMRLYLDKFIISNGHEDEYCRQKRCLLTLAMTILARGVPFYSCRTGILRNQEW